MQKRLTLTGIGRLLKAAFINFSKNNIFRLSGSLAFFTVFSIGPMLIVIIFFADLFWELSVIERMVYSQIKDIVGPQAAVQLQEIIQYAAISNKGNITAITGFVTLLIGSTTVFSEIHYSINTIWGLKAKTKKSWLKMLLNRVLSFSIVVSWCFILLVSLMFSGIIEMMMAQLQYLFPTMSVIVAKLLNLLLTFCAGTFLFAVIFKVLPDAKIKWKDVLVGAITTSVLFMLGKYGIRFYIDSSEVSSTFGAAGSLVLLLVWIYYASLILYFGAGFTKVYAAEYGSHIHPDHAVWIKQIEVEEKDAMGESVN